MGSGLDKFTRVHGASMLIFVWGDCKMYLVLIACQNGLHIFFISNSLNSVEFGLWSPIGGLGNLT